MSDNQSVFRVDKFIVPQASKQEFLQRVLATHEILRKQPGFIQDQLLEQVAGPGRYNIVTIAQWQSQATIDAAKAVVMEAHQAMGFSAQETMQRLGIEGDIGNYQVIGG
ncbi:antibiotic biosynthesis monooxygenase [Bowmanella sp. Y26]|uniref:antibiotic biosynthesis monooxygenase family protein n=1 Tax=Bowmanella yangjiangensis TaxID=2811230 RepID=UPI001BDC3758|nr:antibiotic biosynthesis monooxygenase family protein [Bowmanella yangjiangensis]MBT1063163.1 antibiotic biosynthesis monooxygenase [Bowmanella yangjiangensis]